MQQRSLRLLPDRHGPRRSVRPHLTYLPVMADDNDAPRRSRLQTSYIYSYGREEHFIDLRAGLTIAILGVGGWHGALHGARAG